MKIIRDHIALDELKKMTEKMHGALVKAVVDIERGIMVVDAEMHSDEEEFLLEDGSKQENLWGINFHPDHYGTDQWIEFDSMINLRPSQSNRSRGVENPETRKKIKVIVDRLVKV